MATNIPLADITDTSTTIDYYTPRKKIYVRKMTGFFQAIRRYSLSLLILMYFSFVWIEVSGQPLILLDLGNYRFHLFGTTFWPQDFTLLTTVLLIAAFGLFFITALFGRVWCGYSCPQTAWTLWFIWLEEWFEGSRHRRIKQDQAPMSLPIVLRKAGKHLSWLVVAFATALTFVGYFYPIRALSAELLTLSLSSGWLLFWLAFFTLATYINAGWLREQVCIYMCPYARFQSVMVNENTHVVAYDATRGEPRARHTHRLSHSKGDCVDCHLCVQVCPVGIDIRDGLQYECIGCALCIDACDGVMRKLERPGGLIRYASERELAEGSQKRKWDLRVLAYGLVLVLAVMAFVFLLVTRPVFELSATRERGALFHHTGLDGIRNFYTLQIINKSDREVLFAVQAEGAFPLQLFPSQVTLDAGEVVDFPVSVEARAEDINASKSQLLFSVSPEGAAGAAVAVDSSFFGPVSRAP